ncbi:Regulator of cell autolysis [Flavobacteriales bacterium ALC-1]|nr:Regulator of cell autolysis [Flavobacteriales bacterium ALC-1]
MQKLFSVFLILLLVNCNKNNSQSDTSRIAYLHKKAKNNVNDSTLLYIKEAKTLIDKNNKLPDTLRIENIFRKGYYYLQKEELDSASYYFHRTIDLIEAPNNRKRNRVYFQNTWQTDERIDNKTNAISAVQKFIDISNEENNIGDLLFAYNALERIYLDLKNYNKALVYNSMAIDAALKAGNIDMYIVEANSKAKTLHQRLGEKEKAYLLLDSLIAINDNIEVKRQIYRTYGELNYYDDRYNKAISYYKIVLELTKKVKDNYNFNLLESYNNIAEAYLDSNNYTLTEKYLDSSKAIITSNSYPDYVSFYNELRFRYNYRTKDDEDEALNEFLTLVYENKRQHEEKINEKLTDSELSNQNEQEAISQRNKAELDKIKLLGLLGLLALMIIIGYLFYRQRRYKFERESLQMQQRLLRSQMKPHFIFNTLSVIQNQVKENKEGAVNYLLKFSRLLRLILENSLNDYVQIEDELESLREYLDLQLIRFPDKFNYNINIENFEEEELLFIPPMLIQPFVENSIEHGFLGINYKGEINIKLCLQDKWITCIIEDNGVGIKASNSELKNSVSVNLISKFIQKTTKQKISIIDKETETQSASGVLVKFLIPYKFSQHD